MCIRSARRAPGFTLIEVLIAIIVLAVATVGVLLVYASASRGTANALINKQAMAIAEAMVEEIELTAFSNPSGGFSGAATPANRQNFDDVSDYNGYASTGVFTIDNIAITLLANYNVSVTVTASAFAGGASAADDITAADAKLITVTVTNPTAGVSVSFDGWRVNYP
jgi:MSHA pilin protein MshD